MPKVSEQHLQTRRDQILEGARRAFARHGYEGATVTRLEQEIGLSRGAIFNYFDDKWSIFYELAARDQYELLTLLVDHGLDATIRHMTEENPDWLGVYFELTRQLRSNPELLKDFQQRAPQELQTRAEDALRALHDGGVYRNDVSFEGLIAFINVVANGLALATTLGLKIDVDELLTLVHTGIDPPAK